MIAEKLDIRNCMIEPLDFENAIEMGWYSIDGRRDYYNDDRQKKYLFMPSTENVYMDLNADLDNMQERGTRGADSMEYFLRWIIEHKTCLKWNNEYNQEENVDFVTLRGTLKKILCIPHMRLREDESICAIKIQDIIYFYRLEELTEPSEIAKKMSFWGHIFEHHVTTSEIGGKPDIHSSNYALEEFCIIVKRNLGEHALLFKAEIDCIDPEYQESNQPESTAKYVEIKTSRLDVFRDEKKVYNTRFLTWWAQSYVVGITKTIFGLRDSKGIVRKLKTIKTSKMAELGQEFWSKTKCISFCNQFLNFMKRCITEDNPDVVYRFYQEENFIRCDKMVTNIDPRFKTIPEWYISEVIK